MAPLEKSTEDSKKNASFIALCITQSTAVVIRLFVYVEYICHPNS